MNFDGYTFEKIGTIRKELKNFQKTKILKSRECDCLFETDQCLGLGPSKMTKYKNELKAG